MNRLPVPVHGRGNFPLRDLLQHNNLALIFFPALLLTLWLTPLSSGPPSA